MVIVWEVAEVIVIGLVLWFIAFQVVAPLIKGTPLYPMFRKEKKLQEELMVARQAVVESSLKEEIKKTKNRV
jgi:flagellar biosynthesis/type III secretory pathway M-ring protein FliF/YscJ